LGDKLKKNLYESWEYEYGLD